MLALVGCMIAVVAFLEIRRKHSMKDKHLLSHFIIKRTIRQEDNYNGKNKI